MHFQNAKKNRLRVNPPRICSGQIRLRIFHAFSVAYRVVLPVGFLRFGEGNLRPMAQKFQNSEIPAENEGSGAGIMKIQRKMKVLASCCWAEKRVS